MIIIKGQKYSKKSLEMEINIVVNAANALGRMNFSLVNNAGVVYWENVYKIVENHLIELQSLLDDPREKILKEMVWSSVGGSHMSDDTAREILRVLDESVKE